MSSGRYLCFPETFSLIASQLENVPEKGGAGDEDSPEGTKSVTALIHTNVTLLKELEVISRKANAVAGGRCVSRSGKMKQRWASDPVTLEYLRLVAGCVPILKDSRILLIKSSSGNDWLIPKGGWEDDETLEECAIRESYEEAGVLGLLGLRLGTYKMETRKARAIRLEENKDTTRPTDENVEQYSLSSLPPSTHLVTPDLNDRKRSGSLSHNYVCMSFFPLYVHTIRQTWPENHRERQAFSIDGKLFLSDFIRSQQSPLIDKLCLPVRCQNQSTWYDLNYGRFCVK
jgi:8-oxo-dGTP pyrophosphatase MutT (NUDIX family)